MKSRTLQSFIEEELTAIKTADGKIIAGEKVDNTSLEKIKQSTINNNEQSPSINQSIQKKTNQQTQQPQSKPSQTTMNKTNTNQNNNKININGKETEIINADCDMTECDREDEIVEEIYDELIKENYEVAGTSDKYDFEQSSNYTFDSIVHLSENMYSEYANAAKAFLHDLKHSQYARKVIKEMLYEGIIKNESYHYFKSIQELFINNANEVFDAMIKNEYFIVSCSFNIKNENEDSYDVLIQTSYSKSGVIKQINVTSDMTKTKKINKENSMLNSIKNQSVTTKAFLNTIIDTIYDEEYNKNASLFTKGNPTTKEVKL